MNPSLGIVIPTRGERPDLLSSCLASLVSASVGYCCVVTSKGEPFDSSILPNWVDHVVANNAGVVHAINTGFRHLISEYDCEFISWLGDDDELKPGEARLIEILQANAGYVAGIGACRYVSGDLEEILVLRPRKRDVTYLEMFHNRLPQPGSVFRTDALLQTGLLNPTLKYAFDQDLFHRMKRIGQIAITNEVVSQYMWHSGSLSWLNRRESVWESHMLRLTYGNPLQNSIARLYFSLFRGLSLLIHPRLK